MTYEEKMEHSTLVSTRKIKYKKAKVITPKRRIINIIITCFMTLFTIYSYFIKEKIYVFLEMKDINPNEFMIFVYPVVTIVLITNIILTFTTKSVYSKNHPFRHKAVMYLNKFNKLFIATINLLNASCVLLLDLFNRGFDFDNSSFEIVFKMLTSDFDIIKDAVLFLVALFTFIPYLIVGFVLYYVIPSLLIASPFLYLIWIFSANDIFYNYVDNPDEKGYIIVERRRITLKHYKIKVFLKKFLCTVCVVLVFIMVIFGIVVYETGGII